MRNPFLHIRIARHLSLPAYIKWSHQHFIAPFYHVVTDESLPHIRNLYQPKTTAEFEKDLDLFLKYYHPVSVGDLPSIDKKKNCFLLSFDDGLRQFHEVVAPILWRKGIPCICFLNSAFIDNQALFYRFKQSILIDALNRQPQKGLPGVGEILKTSHTEDALLEQWAQLAGIDFNDFLQKERPYMTRNEIRSLAEKGFHFGGHSIDHPLYSTLSLEEQLQQTQESTSIATGISGDTHRYFSFPFTDDGVSMRFFSDIQKDIQYTFGTAGLKHDTATRNIQRIPMEQGSLTGREVLQNEYAYYLLKTILFKNHINRT